MLLIVGLVFVLGSAITPVRGGENADLPALPIITIHSTGDSVGARQVHSYST
jgi:hypothetical protein